MWDTRVTVSTGIRQSCFGSSITSLDGLPLFVPENFLSPPSKAPYVSAAVTFKSAFWVLQRCDIAWHALQSNRHQHVVGDYVSRKLILWESQFLSYLKYLPASFSPFPSNGKTFDFQDTPMMTWPLPQLTNIETRAAWAGVPAVAMTSLNRIVLAGQYISTSSFAKVQLIGIHSLRFECNERQRRSISIAACAQLYDKFPTCWR